MRALPGIAASAALAAWALGSSTARAYEDQVTLGVEAGYAMVPLDNALPTHGAAVGLSGSLGLSDVFTARAHLLYGMHPDSGIFHVAVAGAEVLYLVDIVEIVPYFGLGLDALGTLFDGTAGVELGAHGTLGVDYLWSRELSVGFDIRPHLLPLQVEADRVDPVYVTFTGRVSFIWDL